MQEIRRWQKNSQKIMKIHQKITKIRKNSQSTAQKGAVFNKWSSDEENVE